jgi:hypothetical protein
MHAQDSAHAPLTLANPGAVFHEDHPRRIILLPAVGRSCFRAIATGASKRQNGGRKSWILLREPGTEYFQPSVPNRWGCQHDDRQLAGYGPAQ